MGDTITAYVRFARLVGLSSATITRRRKVCRMFVADQRIRRPEQVTTAAIEQWLSTRPNPQTRRSYLGDLRAFCRWMVRDSHLTADPTATIPTPKVPKRIPRPLSASDVAALRTGTLEPVDRAIVILALFAGLRVSEIAALDAADIDRGRRIITVRNGKGSKDRTVPAAACILAAVADTGPAIGASMGGENVSARIRRVFARCDIVGHRPHDLRATFATELLRSSGDVAVVGAVLGHSSLTTTQRYLLVDPPGVDVIDGLFAA